jgi:hypothetical protein
MTEIEWFAFVILPLGVAAFGVVVAAVGVKLIDRADHRHKPAE